MRTMLNEQTSQRKPLWGRPPSFLDIPGIDMYAEDGELVTEVLLPEFQEPEIKVDATSEGLEINAFRAGEGEIDTDEEKTYFMHEGRQSYWRHLSLPREAKPEAMTWTFRNGRLKITMPIGLPPAAAKTNLVKRKEVRNDLHKAAAEAKRTKTPGYRDQEFPNHWTRYRPVR